jgi:hypothetical protein
VVRLRRGLGHDPAKTGEPQTHRNYSWRDYGNRIGVWRLFDLFDELKLPAAHNANSLLYEYAPQIMDAIRRRGDEVVGHGRTNAENLRGLWQPDEERILREVTETIARHEGAPPSGWMGSGAYETPNTPDLLKELGYKYLMDWPMDDQPVWLRTRSGPLLSIPYPIELNDAQVVIHRKQDAFRLLRHGRRPVRRDARAERAPPARDECLSPHLRVRAAVPAAPPAQRVAPLHRARRALPACGGRGRARLQISARACQKVSSPEALR